MEEAFREEELRSDWKYGYKRIKDKVKNGEQKKERLPRGRIELPSKDYPSRAWSYLI
jgi:hypothetical protein